MCPDGGSEPSVELSTVRKGGAGIGRMAASGLTRTGNMETEELGLPMGVASLNPATPTGKPTTALVTLPQFAKYKNTLIIILDSFYSFTLWIHFDAPNVNRVFLHVGE